MFNLFWFADKARRQAKAVKPKKMLKVEGQFIIDAACNNGTTALVTREGELLMFGKDTTHCDPTTGNTLFKTEPELEAAKYLELGTVLRPTSL